MSLAKSPPLTLFCSLGPITPRAAIRTTGESQRTWKGGLPTPQAQSYPDAATWRDASSPD